jgi:hypothetical protein
VRWLQRAVRDANRAPGYTRGVLRRLAIPIVACTLPGLADDGHVRSPDLAARSSAGVGLTSVPCIVRPLHAAGHTRRAARG